VIADAALPALAVAALDVGACSLRLLPVVALSPFLGGPLLPPAARAGLALGAALAFAVSLPIEAARGAGRLVDTLRGATLGELHVPLVRQRETAVGDLLAQWTVALGAWAGADRLLVAALLGTFRAVPVGGALPGVIHVEAAASAAADLLSAAVCLGAPAAAALLCADLALSAASRLAPRSSLLDAAPPIRALLGLAAVALPAAAIGGRLVELAALAGGLVERMVGAP
jgi:type III secretory pathway component EscT